MSPKKGGPAAAVTKKSGELEVPVKELLPILNLLKGFTADRDIVPGLRHLWFAGDTIRASAGEASAMWCTPWTFPGEFSVSADLLTRLVNSLNDQGHETCSFALADSGVVLRSPGFRATLNRYAPAANEDLSAYLQREPPTAGRIALSPAWWKALDRLMFSVCQDETKPALRGVFWADNGLLMATDTFRISVLSPDVKTRVLSPHKGGFLLPDHLLSRLGGRRREATETCLERDSIQWFFFESGAVAGSLLHGAFPAKGCAGILKGVRMQGQEQQGTVVQLPEGAPLLIVLARLLEFAAPPTYRLEAAVGKDTLTLRVRDSDGAGREAEEVLPAVVVGPPVTFAMNGKYFRDAIEQVGGRFWIGPQGSTVMYFVSGDKHLEHMIMLLALVEEGPSS